MTGARAQRAYGEQSGEAQGAGGAEEQPAEEAAAAEQAGVAAQGGVECLPLFGRRLELVAGVGHLLVADEVPAPHDQPDADADERDQ